MGKVRLTALLVVLLLVATALAGCAPKSTEPAPPPPPPGRADKTTLIISHMANPASLNPNWKNDSGGFAIHQNVFNKLVTITGDNEIRPDLAKEWKISDDGLTYTFYLNQGVKWHDGKPFTSSDVKWTIEAIQTNKGRMFKEYSAIERIELPDVNTVVLHLSRPDASLLSFLSWMSCQIMPEHIYAGTDWTTNPANQQPIGTGPYKFVSWKPDESIELVANESYFKGAPAVRKLVFKIIPDASTALQAFKNGEVDIMGSPPPTSELPALEKDPKFTVLLKDTPSRWYLGLNLARPALEDLRVREAIAMAVNRAEILEKAFSGYGAEAWSFYTPAIPWAYNGKDLAPAFDVQKANALMDAAGLKPDTNGFRLKLDFVQFSNPQVDSTATILKEQLKKIGIDLNLVRVEMAVYGGRIFNEMNFDLTMLSGYWGPDPHNLYSRVITGGGMAATGTYKPEALETLFLDAIKESDQAKRGEMYKQAQTILSKDLPIVPLIETKVIVVYQSDITGHPQSPEGCKAGLSFNDYSLIKFK